MTLDVLRMQRRLRGVGVPQEQAEVFAEEVAHILSSQVATKADLQELRNEMLGKFAGVDSKFAGVDGKFAEVNEKIAELATRIAELRNEMAELRNEVADLKTGITKWVVGLIVAIMLGVAGMSVAMVWSVFRLASALG